MLKRRKWRMSQAAALGLWKDPICTKYKNVQVLLSVWLKNIPLIPRGGLKMDRQFWPSPRWDQVSISLESGWLVMTPATGARGKCCCLTSKGRQAPGIWCLHLRLWEIPLWEHWATMLDGHILALQSTVPTEPGLPAVPTEVPDSWVKLPWTLHISPSPSLVITTEQPQSTLLGGEQRCLWALPKFLTHRSPAMRKMATGLSPYVKHSKG